MTRITYVVFLGSGLAHDIQRYITHVALEGASEE